MEKQYTIGVKTPHKWSPEEEWILENFFIQAMGIRSTCVSAVANGFTIFLHFDEAVLIDKFGSVENSLDRIKNAVILIGQALNFMG